MCGTKPVQWYKKRDRTKAMYPRREERIKIRNSYKREGRDDFEKKLQSKRGIKPRTSMSTG